MTCKNGDAYCGLNGRCGKCQKDDAERREKMIERLRKLLNVTRENNATEGEVENAMRLARQLMHEHGLSEADAVLHKPETVTVTSQEAHERLRKGPRPWVRSLATAVAKACDCQAVFSQNTYGHTIKFIGLEVDVAVAVELFGAMELAVRALARRLYSTTPERRSYRTGFVQGLWDKLNEQQAAERRQSAQSGAIVLAKGAIIKRWMDENLTLTKGRSTPAAPVDASAYLRGRADGQMASLARNALNGGQR